MELVAGQKLQNGKYIIEHELGRGRFAITYLAKKTDGERQVIKILDPQVLAALTQKESNRLEEQFWKESVILAMCNNSPNIVKVYMPFREGSIACLPMEYIDGKSLADRSQKILTEELALKYIWQVGEALAEVHSQKLVHCDIRPANIFLRSRDGLQEAVLADFGLSLEFGMRLTSTRARERVDGFSSPELYVRDRPVGAYTDVYSLAATLYDILTGEPPMSVTQRDSTTPLKSPQVNNHNLSALTTKAILEGLELLPEKRPDTVKAWLDKLPSLPAVSKTTKNTKVNWQTIWMATGVLVALFVGIPAWLTWAKIDLTRSTPIPPSSSPKITGK
jgi:eukaryotic-like serine/threonine-protein kinase